MEIQGHRGARALRPENTLPGLARALAIGVDALEFDVMLTGDGELILAHDLVSRRGRFAIPERDRRPPDPFQDTFEAAPGAGVPTLDQVCRLVTESGADQVTLAVELKTDPTWAAAEVRKLTRSAIATLAAHGLTGRIRILGFDWRVLEVAAEDDPAVPRVALVEPRTWVPGSAWLAGRDSAAYPAGSGGCARAARDLGAQWLSPWDGMTSPQLIAAAHDEGLRTAVWTVNDPDRMTELCDLAADAIVTDRPDVLRAVLAARGAPVPAPHKLPWPDGVPGEVPAWAPGARTS